MLFSSSSLHLSYSFSLLSSFRTLSLRTAIVYCKLRVAREYELLCVEREREHDEVRGRKDKDFVTFFFSSLDLQLYEFTPIIIWVYTGKMQRRNVGG